MKKLIILGLIILLFVVGGVLGVRINEVELNPAGKDGGNEWVELYSEQEIDLAGWELVNDDNDVFELNQGFQGYLVIDFETQWLDNEDEKVVLYEGLRLVDETDLFSDADNDDKTWSYCGDWVFVGQTKGLVNFCEEKDEGVGADNILESDGEVKKDFYEEEIEEVEELKEKEVIQIGSKNEIIGVEGKPTAKVIYESKSEKIKKYAVFGFALFCVVFGVLLVWTKLN